MIELSKITQTDLPLILSYIKKLAHLEGRLSDVTSSLADLDCLFLQNESPATCLIAKLDQYPIGFVAYYRTVSTFSGKVGIYIEDLYIEPEFRGSGYGTHILKMLKSKAERLSWWCHIDNVDGKKFYQKLGSTPKLDFTVYHWDT